VTLRLDPIPHVGSHLLFLEEVLTALADRGVNAPLLFRASELDKIERVLALGTDRAGYPTARPGHGAIAHEDMILATTEEDILRGERDPAFSTSFKKFGLSGPPLLLVYDARRFELLREKEYVFRHPDRKGEALLALIPVDMQPEIGGWFTQDEGVAYRRLVAEALGRPRDGVRRIVEVGCWLGRSTAWIARYCAARGAELIAVDHYDGSADAYDAAYRATLAAQDVATAFSARMAALGGDVRLCRSPSHVAAESFAPGSVDLVFLDASHDEASVRQDLAAWWPRLHAGGIMAGHDFSADHRGLIAAVTSFAEGQGLRVERGPGSIWWLAG
jgi:predicted O-methyltransferase YrrM